MSVPGETLLISVGVAILLLGCGEATPEPCTPDWNLAVESQLGTGDGRGHGPDLGSMEWRSVIEFKLGIRGQSDVPARDSEAWCEFIDRKIFQGGG